MMWDLKLKFLWWIQILINLATLLKNNPEDIWKILDRSKEDDCILSKEHDSLNKFADLIDKVKNPIHPTEVFDMIVGTSTGEFLFAKLHFTTLLYPIIESYHSTRIHSGILWERVEVVVQLTSSEQLSRTNSSAVDLTVHQTMYPLFYNIVWLEMKLTHKWPF